MENSKAMSVEETFEQIEDRINKLESANLTLEESFLVYHEGMKLLKECNDSIDKIEKKVLKLNEDMQADEF